MNSDLFVKVAMCIISLICALISAYVIPYIKTKAKAADFDKLMEFAWVAVRCANQIYTPDQWTGPHVLPELTAAFVMPNLPDIQELVKAVAEEEPAKLLR